VDDGPLEEVDALELSAAETRPATAEPAAAQPTVAVTSLGDPLPGTDPDLFAEAAEVFGDIESIADGLGPTFNEAACGTCHSIPVLGGSGSQIERRFGRVTNGVFFGFDNDEENQGGTLRQLFANGAYEHEGQACNVPVEVEPASANVNNVGRRTTPLFGLGLVDVLPDSVFDANAAGQPASIRGVVQRVRVALPDPRDPTQSIGSMRVARFGHKGLVPTLLVFSGDAYDNEMGITTQSCFAGTSILEFSVENHPNNVPPPAGCNGGDLAPANPPGDPNVPEFTDDVVGPCDGGRTEIQDDLVLFTNFMESLAPPPQDLSDPIGIIIGGINFHSIGCDGCHLSKVYVTPLSPFNGVPGLFPFLPFSDFLAHDMGSLGDGIGETGDPIAQTRLMRTAPLWGARFNTQFLHDGRATNVRDAILAHDGQAAESRTKFSQLSSFGRQTVVRFVNSL
jgi:CxxC motif-containing protein (DUF1111 family)